jgi:nucleoside-diphosphate-sugar epimerase
MNILITGGAGYLGGVTALQLLEAGHCVRVLDNLLFGPASVAALVGHPRFDFVRVNLLNSGLVAAALDDIHAVVHLAAIVGDPACARDPHLARRINLDGSKELV